MERRKAEHGEPWLSSPTSWPATKTEKSRRRIPVRKVFGTFAIIVAVATVISAAPTFACTIIFDHKDEPTDGLSERDLNASFERQRYKMGLERERQAWMKADYVFLAEVTSLRASGDNQVLVALKPITSLKGQVGTRRVLDRYSPNLGSTCGPTPYPGIGEAGIFYGRKLPWWKRLLNWGGPEVVSALPLTDVTGSQIPNELRAAAARLRRTKAQ